MLNVSIVTPVYAPAPGGGASYTKFLAEGLGRYHDMARISVFTERFPGQPNISRTLDGRVTVHRRFPWRAGRDQVDLRSYFDYAVQNVDFARIDDWLPSETNVLVVHSHHHYKPNLLCLGLQRLKAKRGSAVQLVLDVRDRLITTTMAPVQELYDNVICCSRNVEAHMRNLGERRPLHHIPIIYDAPEPPAQEAVARTLQSLGLSGQRYLLSTSGIDLAKGVDELLACVRELRRRGEQAQLVVAGRKRDWARRHADAEAEGLMRHLGSLPQDEIFHLMAGSEIHLNLSTNEGLPRSSLEAIASGTRALLPPKVPEFAEYCAAHVAATNEPSKLADQVQLLLEQPKAAPAYPLALHSTSQTIPQYLKLFLQARRDA